MYPVAVDQSRRPVRSRWRRNAGDAEGLAWDGDGGDIEQGQLNNGQGIAGSVVGGGAIVLSEEGNCDIENKQKDGQDEQFPVSGEVCFFFVHLQLVDQVFGGIDGDGESDTDIAPAFGKDEGVDTDHFTTDIDQRPA